MKEQIVQTIWALAQALSGALAQPGIDATGVAKAAGVELKLHKENDYVRFYESTRSLRLANGVVVGKLDVRESRTQASPPSSSSPVYRAPASPLTRSAVR